MPRKSQHSEYMRQWRDNNPEKSKLYIERAASSRRKRGSPKRGINTSHFENSLGPYMEATQKHVVLSRLLRRLLQEAWDKGYLKPSNTQDDSEYEMRTKAALDVSVFLVHVEPDETDSKIEGPV